MDSRNALRQQLGLYLVTDERENCDSLLDVVRKALQGGVTTVQLRRKRDDGRLLVQLGRAIRQLTAEFAALYIVNDRVDIALLTDADGVHVGQSDIPCTEVRKLIGNRIVGVSVCMPGDALEAEWAGADYLGVGAVFPTSSKSDADMCGLHGLTEIAQSAHVPIVGIGGIDATNAREVVQAGAGGIAVVSAVMQADNPTRAVAELCRIVEAAKHSGPNGSSP